MSIIVDRLKEAEKAARANKYATWITLIRGGVRVECRSDGGTLSAHRIVTWEEIESALVNLITHAVHWTHQQIIDIVRERRSMKS